MYHVSYTPVPISFIPPSFNTFQTIQATQSFVQQINIPLYPQQPQQSSAPCLDHSPNLSKRMNPYELSDELTKKAKLSPSLSITGTFPNFIPVPQESYNTSIQMSSQTALQNYNLVECSLSANTSNYFNQQNTLWTFDCQNSYVGGNLICSNYVTDLNNSFIQSIEPQVQIMPLPVPYVVNGFYPQDPLLDQSSVGAVAFQSPNPQIVYISQEYSTSQGFSFKQANLQSKNQEQIASQTNDFKICGLAQGQKTQTEGKEKVKANDGKHTKIKLAHRLILKETSREDLKTFPENCKEVLSKVEVRTKIELVSSKEKFPEFQKNRPCNKCNSNEELLNNKINTQQNRKSEEVKVHDEDLSKSISSCIDDGPRQGVSRPENLNLLSSVDTASGSSIKNEKERKIKQAFKKKEMVPMKVVPALNLNESKMNRRKNLWQLQKEEKEKIEALVMTGEISTTKHIRCGLQYQAVITELSLNEDETSRRKPKLAWCPEGNSEEDL